ncbi:MAG: efflux RND transporter periplasmic adaptor subunit [Planctomycetota bacterium]|jgi:RND family efflux transporter MFP subunit
MVKERFTNLASESSKEFNRLIKVFRALPKWQQQLLLVFIILAIGAGIGALLKYSRKPPARVERTILPPLVEVQAVHKKDTQMIVQGHGTVSPKVQVDIVPQVSGKVVYINPQFKAGGFIHANEQLLKIDPRDYELAVQQANAFVAEAQVILDLEKAEAQVARQEWQQLNPDKEPASPLVFREPQIRQAEAKLESAKASLATAKLHLERTQVSLPIDIRIIRETVDLGQYVMAGQPLGTAYGIDAVEVEVPLEDRELAWFDIPDDTVSFNGNPPSNKRTIAHVKADFAGSNNTWTGYVKRTTGQVDKTSRFISVVVEVPKPFDASNGRPALLPGTFVEVLIQGNTLKDAVAVPRDSIHEGNSVWVVKDGRLHIQPLDVVRAEKDFAYVVSGLEDGAMIVVGSLDAVTEAMKVRTQVDLPEPAEPESMEAK